MVAISHEAVVTFLDYLMEKVGYRKCPACDGTGYLQFKFTRKEIGGG